MDFLVRQQTVDCSRAILLKGNLYVFLLCSKVFDVAI